MGKTWILEWKGGSRTALGSQPWLDARTAGCFINLQVLGPHSRPVLPSVVATGYNAAIEKLKLEVCCTCE